MIPLLLLLITPLTGQVRAFAAEYGKSFGYEQTLVAIAWQESSFVQDTCSVYEDSCGPFGNRVSVVARRSGLPPDVIRHRLRTDLRFAAHYAVAELDFWRGRCVAWRVNPHSRKAWVHLWGHYNQGYTPNLNYGEQILAKIKKGRK